MFKKTLSLIVVVFLFSSSVFAVGLDLPVVDGIVKVSDSYDLPFMRGVRYDVENPFNLEFIFDRGSEDNVSVENKEKIIRYFLAALTVPASKLWVNLSPYESDRIIDNNVAQTEIGETLLSQDYLLKQLSSSLTHPDSDLGKEYWKTNNSHLITHDESNKIWIKPGEITLYDGGDLLMIADAQMKIESESSDKDVLLPTIMKDVNQGRNFSQLRQMYYSIIMAQYFKKEFADSLYEYYFDKEKMNDIDMADPSTKEKVFKMYTSSFQKGVYDLIQKGWDSKANKKVKRHYFSGGIKGEVDFTSSSVAFIDETTFSSNLKEQECTQVQIIASSGVDDDPFSDISMSEVLGDLESFSKSVVADKSKSSNVPKTIGRTFMDMSKTISIEEKKQLILKLDVLRGKINNKDEISRADKKSLLINVADVKSSVTLSLKPYDYLNDAVSVLENAMEASVVRFRLNRIIDAEKAKASVIRRFLGNNRTYFKVADRGFYNYIKDETVNTYNRYKGRLLRKPENELDIVFRYISELKELQDILKNKMDEVIIELDADVRSDIENFRSMNSLALPPEGDVMDFLENWYSTNISEVRKVDVNLYKDFRKKRNSARSKLSFAKENNHVYYSFAIARYRKEIVEIVMEVTRTLGVDDGVRLLRLKKYSGTIEALNFKHLWEIDSEVELLYRRAMSNLKAYVRPRNKELYEKYKKYLRDVFYEFKKQLTLTSHDLEVLDVEVGKVKESVALFDEELHIYKEELRYLYNRVERFLRRTESDENDSFEKGMAKFRTENPSAEGVDLLIKWYGNSISLIKKSFPSQHARLTNIRTGTQSKYTYAQTSLYLDKSFAEHQYKMNVLNVCQQLNALVSTLSGSARSSSSIDEKIELFDQIERKRDAAERLLTDSPEVLIDNDKLTTLNRRYREFTRNYDLRTVKKSILEDFDTGYFEILIAAQDWISDAPAREDLELERQIEYIDKIESNIKALEEFVTVLLAVRQRAYDSNFQSFEDFEHFLEILKNMTELDDMSDDIIKSPDSLEFLKQRIISIGLSGDGFRVRQRDSGAAAHVGFFKEVLGHEIFILLKFLKSVGIETKEYENMTLSNESSVVITELKTTITLLKDDINDYLNKISSSTISDSSLDYTFKESQLHGGIILEDILGNAKVKKSTSNQSSSIEHHNKNHPNIKFSSISKQTLKNLTGFTFKIGKSELIPINKILK